jgi:hypothetical protein
MEQVTEHPVAGIEKMDAKTDAKRERMMAKLDAWLEEVKDNRKETTACQEATKTCLEKMEEIQENCSP